MNLTRRQTLIGTAVLLASPVMAALPFRFKEVADGVWLFQGAQESFAKGNLGDIANVVLIATAEGAVIFDTGSTATFGKELRDFADQKLGGVALVLNSHNHPDHWFGNQAFADRPIRALPVTRETCAANSQGYSDNLYRILGSAMNGTSPLPATEDAAAGDISIGGRDLTLIQMSGHTAADLVVIDRHSGTILAGDLLFLDRAPSFPDADVNAWHAALDQLASMEVSGVIPGHGEYRRDNSALAQTRLYLDAFEARMRQAISLGLSPSEAMAAGPMPDFASLGANPEEYHRAVVQTWRGFETEDLPIIGGL